MKPLVALACLTLFAAVEVKAAPSYVPKPGSSTRVEICDAVRRSQHTPNTKYVIYYLRVQDDWALFDAAKESAPDGALAAVLHRQGGAWTVVGSWMHGDVPDASEYKSKAAGLPDSLVTEYNRERLGKAR